VSNWSDGTGWKFFSYTASLAASSNQFIMYLGTAGEIYIDDLALVAGSTPAIGQNLIRNGDFEGPLLTNNFGPWALFNPAGISNTVISTDVKHSGNASLRVAQRLAGPTAYMFQNGVIVPATGTHTISFWYLPITNAGATFTVRVNTSFRPNASVRLAQATPGIPNSSLALLPPYPPVWLNELQPNNTTGIRDGSDTAEPWIELYNGGTNAVSLAGLFLSDNYGSNLTQWPFPAEMIGPGEFRIIWADGDPEESTPTEWHTSFRLHPSSGTVALTRLLGTDPQVLDYLTFNNIGQNLSYGDYPDGQPFNRTVFYTVTPGATNQAQPGAIFINEWLAQNQGSLIDPADGDLDDWFELFNPNDFPVDLGGYYLSDTLTNKTQYRIPNGYVVPAHGYLLVWADNETGQNSSNRVDLHANFALSRTGEAIGLFSPDGTLIDGITFGVQTNDISEGRFPDGAANRYYMTTLTPRAANIVTGLDNTPPALASIANKFVTLGQTLSFTANATDAEAPPQTLSFSLTTFPAGASINTGSGLFTWTPAPGQSPSTNAVTVRVADNGSPSLSDSKSFTIFVVSPPRVTLGKNGSQVTLSFGAVNGQQYQVEYNDELLPTGWQALGLPVTANGASVTINDDVGALDQRFYRIRLVE
jgi:hypothetical protein